MNEYEELKNLVSNSDWTDIKKVLKSKGYESLRGGGVLIGKKYTVKNCKKVYFTVKKLSKKAELHTVPCVKIKNFLIQSTCDTSPEAVQKARNFFRNNKDTIHLDDHSGNIGLLYGQPVLFDW